MTLEEETNEAFRLAVDVPADASMWEVTYRKEGHLLTTNVRAASAKGAKLIMEFFDLDVVAIEPLRLH